MLGKPQSHVSKVESGARRLDVLEYVVWMYCLGVEPVAQIKELAIDIDEYQQRCWLMTHPKQA